MASPFVRRTRRELRRRINVVYTHYVGDNRPYYEDFYVGSTLDRFDADLTTLGQHFEFRSLRDLVQSQHDPASHSDTQSPALAVTFDDGFDLIRNGVVEVLQRHGVKATTFVVTSTVDNCDLMWRNKLSAIRSLRPESVYVREYNDLMRAFNLPTVTVGIAATSASEAWPMDRKEELADQLWKACAMPPLNEFLDEHKPYFTWQGLRAWISMGHEVGLHTHTHPYCSRLDTAAIDGEIIKPSAVLRNRLDLDRLPFSYPFGSRLDEGSEARLYEDGIFDSAFGIEGFAPRGTSAIALQRASIEGELRYSVFGRALLGLPRAKST